MTINVFIIASILYIVLLFCIAFYTDNKAVKSKSWVDNPYVYALSLAVFCTAWTFYGSVGKASRSGFGFLPIYLGPTLFAPLWLMVIRKMIVISKAQRITSIADFVSSRYGKSTFLSILVTIVALLGVVPYISLQLKAIADSFFILVNVNENRASNNTLSSFYFSTAFYLAIALALFTMLFGTRKLDPNERHEGLVTAIAFESVIKLVAFVAVGGFITFGLFNGFNDIFSKAALNESTAKLLFISSSNSTPSEWFWLGILSLCAVILLPRQFHIAVVENTNPNHITKAMWLFPLYMLIINIFVLPIALSGIMELGNIKPDNFVLDLPLLHHEYMLSLLVFIGGFSAAASMVIVETTALSIMVSNHLIMPLLITSLARRDSDVLDSSVWILNVRRISIVSILLMAYSYVYVIAANRELVSIGLISFTAVAQFAPSVFGGMFWKGGTKSGAIWGLIVGFLIWAITLPIPALAEYNLISKDIIQNGYFGLSFLKPYSLLGLEGFDHISHAAFWSLLLNIAIYVGVSLNSRQSQMEITQADYFVNIYKYIDTRYDIEILKREAKLDDLTFLLQRFLGKERAETLIKDYETTNNIDLSTISKANSELVAYVETLLTGVLGASSAKILIGTVVKEDPISLDEMLKVLDKTQEIILTNKELERKSKELEEASQQLQLANDQLKQLDHLKADFVTTITHELRTPMTSIKALSKILMDNPDLPKEQHDEFLRIVVLETERITRLVNQVLDIEKMQSNIYEWKQLPFNLTELVERTYKGFIPVLEEKNIRHQLMLQQNILIKGDVDRITQVVVNLLSNAIKFTNTEGGYLEISLLCVDNQAIIKIKDNGHGIAEDQQSLIFGRFTQINDPTQGKPTGSGLGLFITKQIVEHHKGTIAVESAVGKGATFIVTLPID